MENLRTASVKHCFAPCHTTGYLLLDYKTKSYKGRFTMDKMSKPNWACPICGEDFTRKSSAFRHNDNIHEGRCLPVRYIDYLAGRQSGLYQPPLTPTRLLGSRTEMKFNHRNNQLADSIGGDFSYLNGTEFKNKSEYAAERSFTRATDQDDHITEIFNRVLKLRTLERAFNQPSQTQNMPVPFINFNTIPTDIGIVKPIGFQSYVCNLCLCGPIEEVSKFVEHGSLRKVKHMCDPEQLMKAKHLTEAKREAWNDLLFQFLAGLVSRWIGQDEIYLKAEELFPMEGYEFGTDAKKPPPSYVEDCIDLDI
jgi:hypothetical protein